MKNMKWWVPTALFLGIFLIAMIIAFPMLTPTPRLKVYNPIDLNPQLVDDSLQRVVRNHRALDFTLINQLGDTITEKTFENKIYLTDFFFTTCPTICKDMSKNFRKVQDKFVNETDFLLLSHTVTPQIDSVPVLAKYGEDYGAIPGKWHLATGDKKHIYELARKSYFACLDHGDGGVQDFIHTENLVLVDKDRRLRGFYDGTSDADVDRLITEIGYLLKEYKGR